MQLTSRQRRMLAEADMSRRQFLKLTGQAAAAAASPQSALKGLVGGTPTVSTPIAIAIRPLKEVGVNLAASLAGIQKSFNAAKLVGDGKIGGAAAGCGEAFEVLTFGNLDTIKQLVKSGKLKQVGKHYPAVNDVNFANFGKPLTPEEQAKIKQEATQKALKYINDPNSFMYNTRTDDSKVKSYVEGSVEHALENAMQRRSEFRFKDNAGNNYWITADNDAMKHKTSWFKDVINSQLDDKESPLRDWWDMHYGMTNLDDIEISKQAAEFIKQNGLYRQIDDPFAARRLVDKFEEFGIPLPDDMPKVLERFHGRPGQGYETSWHTPYDDIKPGENYRTHKHRKKSEEEAASLKQKEEFEKAPPPSDEPESWRTQSVEFESRLRRLV